MVTFVARSLRFLGIPQDKEISHDNKRIQRTDESRTSMASQQKWLPGDCLALIGSVLAVSKVKADVPPPDSDPCSGKQEGDACEFADESGTCQTATRSRILPQGWNGEDAGETTVTSTYLACRQSANVAGAGGAANVAGAGGADAPLAPNLDASVSVDDESDAAAGDDSGCSISRSPTAGRTMPWSLAAAFSLLLLRRCNNG